MITHEIIGDDMQAVVVTLGAGFFGGEGFILQRLEGSGEVFIHSGGTNRILAARKGDREDVKRDFGGTFGALGDLIGGDK